MGALGSAGGSAAAASAFAARLASAAATDSCVDLIRSATASSTLRSVSSSNPCVAAKALTFSPRTSPLNSISDSSLPKTVIGMLKTGALGSSGDAAVGAAAASGEDVALGKIFARTCSKRTGTRSSGMLCLCANAVTASMRLSPSKSRRGTTSPSSRETGNSKRGSLLCLDCWMFLVTASAMETRRLVTSALTVARSSALREFSRPNFSTASLTLSPSNRPRSTRVSAILTGISRNGISSRPRAGAAGAEAASCAEAVAARQTTRSRASFLHIGAILGNNKGRGSAGGKLAGLVYVRS
mmetsp:Transcript_2086/g.8808  ORF Transcript_2086/g.8808 Transcript_2086/m.8808 type:complete len:298 (+) Transcript_2086:1391-2284(+)